MQAIEPNRPRLPNGEPQYVSPDGEIMGALPWLQIRPCEEGVDVGIMLKTSTTGFSWKYITLTTWEALLELIKDYNENPEKVMIDYFGYDFQVINDGNVYVNPGDKDEDYENVEGVDAKDPFDLFKG
jgi:hypothetical protein